MLIYFIIFCAIILGGFFLKRMFQIKKDRLEKKKIMEERLKKLIFTNSK